MFDVANRQKTARENHKKTPCSAKKRRAFDDKYCISMPVRRLCCNGLATLPRTVTAMTNWGLMPNSVSTTPCLAKGLAGLGLGVPTFALALGWLGRASLGPVQARRLPRCERLLSATALCGHKGSGWDAAQSGDAVGRCWGAGHRLCSAWWSHPKTGNRRWLGGPS